MTKLDALTVELEKAVNRLKEAAALPSSNVINQDATIQRFEFTFELAWKLMKTIVEEEGLEAPSPKRAIRLSADIDLIADPIKWFEFLEARNNTVHTYKEDIARQVYSKAKEFIPEAENLLKKAQKYLQE